MNKAITTMVAVMLLLVSGAFATYIPPQYCPTGSYLSAENEAVAYANSVANTGGDVNNANNAVGVDDNVYAIIEPDHPNAYITLDMGAGEEVWDSINVDLLIYGDNSEDDNGVDVYVSNSPTTGFQYAGTVDGQGDDGVYIGGTSYDSIRYVRIYNDDNDKNVEIDAVRGYCITNPGNGNDVPEFGTIAAVSILGAAGFFIARKRK